MQMRYWNEDKLNARAIHFIQTHFKIIATFHDEIMYCELHPPTETAVHKKKERYLEILARMDATNMAFNSERLHTFSELLAELNPNDTNSFYTDLPHGFLDLARIIKKIIQRGAAEIERFAREVNEVKHMATSLTHTHRQPIISMQLSKMSSLFSGKVNPNVTPCIRNIEIESPKSNCTPN